MVGFSSWGNTQYTPNVRARNECYRNSTESSCLLSPPVLSEPSSLGVTFLATALLLGPLLPLLLGIGAEVFELVLLPLQQAGVGALALLLQYLPAAAKTEPGVALLPLLLAGVVLLEPVLLRYLLAVVKTGLELFPLLPLNVDAGVLERVLLPFLQIFLLPSFLLL